MKTIDWQHRYTWATDENNDGGHIEIEKGETTVLITAEVLTAIKTREVTSNA